MLHRTLVAAAAFMSASASLAQNVNTDPRNAPVGLYEIEPSHTSVCFTVVHMGLSAYPGCFTKISGKIGFDHKYLDSGKVDIEIDLDSVATASDKLNGKLKKDFFKTDKNKVATFRSAKSKVLSPGKGTVSGELTLNGVTKPVTLNVVFNGGLKHPFAGRYAIGFDATTTIKRSDFGLTDVDWSAFVSDEVKLVIAVEAIAEE